MGPPDSLIRSRGRPRSSVGSAIRTIAIAVRPIVAIDTRLARVGDVLGPVPLEDLLCPLHLVAIFGMDGQEDVATLDLPLIALGFELRHSVADQRACHAAGSATYGRAAEQTHDRAGRDQRPDARNGESADAREPAEHST